MTIMDQINLKYNPKMKINFNVGDLTADGGMNSISEFIHALQIDKLIQDNFFLVGDTKNRTHTFPQLALQTILQTIAGYHHQDCADHLKSDPLFPILLSKETIASQPTLSRFFNEMNLTNSKQIEYIQEVLLDRFYQQMPPLHFLTDLDSTHFNTYGNQQGANYNAHYQKEGFHPLLAFDGLTGDLLKAELRAGNVYTSRQTVRFLGPILKRNQKNYPGVLNTVRGDSGFAILELYKLCEALDARYCIRLKSNKKLQAKAYELASSIMTDELVKEEKVMYKDFNYKAGSWDKVRRVVVKIVKPKEEMIPTFSFFVTNMDLSPKNVFKFYANRGVMENMIKEIKSGFRMDLASHSNFITNVNRMQLVGLAYNIFNGFRRLVLPANHQKMQIETMRRKVLRVTAKKVKHAGQTTFKFYSAYPHKELFSEIISRIHSLRPVRI